MDGITVSSQVRVQRGGSPPVSNDSVSNEQVVSKKKHEKSNNTSINTNLSHRIVESCKSECLSDGTNHIPGHQENRLDTPSEVLAVTDSKDTERDLSTNQLLMINDFLKWFPDRYQQLTRLSGGSIESTIKEKVNKLLNYQFGSKSCIPFTQREIIVNPEDSYYFIKIVGNLDLICEDLRCFQEEIIKLDAEMNFKLIETNKSEINAQKERGQSCSPLCDNVKETPLASDKTVACHQEDAELLKAAKMGSVVTVHEYLKKKEDGSKTDILYRKLLIVALSYSHEYLAEFLIKKGAKVDLFDAYGRNSLMMAVYTRNIRLVKLIHKRLSESDLSYKDNLGKDILMHAANSGSYQMFEYFHDCGLAIDLKKESILFESILNLAASGGNTGVLLYLFLNGYDKDTQSSSGTTALMSAAENNQLETVKLLIKQGCDLQMNDRSERTALINATREGHFSIVEVLISAGAEVNYVGKEGCPVLFHAVSSRNLEVVKLLVQSGADLTLEDHRGRNVIDFIEFNRSNAEDKIKSEVESYLAQEMANKKQKFKSMVSVRKKMNAQATLL